MLGKECPQKHKAYFTMSRAEDEESKNVSIANIC